MSVRRETCYCCPRAWQVIRMYAGGGMMKYCMSCYVKLLEKRLWTKEEV